VPDADNWQYRYFVREFALHVKRAAPDLLNRRDAWAMICFTDVIQGGDGRIA
jgi:hypothetical protein